MSDFGHSGHEPSFVTQNNSTQGSRGGDLSSCLRDGPARSPSAAVCSSNWTGGFPDYNQGVPEFINTEAPSEHQRPMSVMSNASRGHNPVDHQSFSSAKAAGSAAGTWHEEPHYPFGKPAHGSRPYILNGGVPMSQTTGERFDFAGGARPGLSGKSRKFSWSADDEKDYIRKPITASARSSIGASSREPSSRDLQSIPPSLEFSRQEHPPYQLPYPIIDATENHDMLFPRTRGPGTVLNAQNHGPNRQGNDNAGGVKNPVTNGQGTTADMESPSWYFSGGVEGPGSRPVEGMDHPYGERTGSPCSLRPRDTSMIKEPLSILPGRSRVDSWWAGDDEALTGTHMSASEGFSIGALSDVDSDQHHRSRTPSLTHGPGTAAPMELRPWPFANKVEGSGSWRAKEDQGVNHPFGERTQSQFLSSPDSGREGSSSLPSKRHVGDMPDFGELQNCACGSSTVSFLFSFVKLNLCLKSSLAWLAQRTLHIFATLCRLLILNRER